MTPEAQRIAIATALGRKVCTHHPAYWERRGTEGDSDLFCTECKAYLHNMRTPDYLTDLNTMHEAEKTLDDSQHERFRERLWRLVEESDGLERRDDYDRSSNRAYISSSAAQRAEAFLRTKGLWKD